MQIRDRIKEFRRVPAGQLRPHPRNWRRHGKQQRAALGGLLAEIGYADAVLARELPSGRLQVIDGHLRIEASPDAVVPVLVLDVTAQEAEKLLLTLDPLAQMAEAAPDRLAASLARVEFTTPAVQQMLEELAATAGDPSCLLAAAEEDDLEVPATFQILIDCQSEQEQAGLYASLKKEGYTCRVLTLL